MKELFLTHCDLFDITGWDVGFQQEYDSLVKQIRMSKEEVRLLKADVKKRKMEIFNFYLVNSDSYENLFKI